MVTAIYTGHAPVRGHLYIMGLFDGDTCILWACLMGIQSADFAGQRLKQCSTLFAVARRWLVSATVSGRLIVKPKDISTALVRDLCLFIRGAGLIKLC